MFVFCAQKSLVTVVPLGKAEPTGLRAEIWLGRP